MVQQPTTHAAADAAMYAEALLARGLCIRQDKHGWTMYAVMTAAVANAAKRKHAVSK